MKDIVMINGIEYVPKVIAPEPVKVGRWKPDYGEIYYFLPPSGKIIEDAWNSDENDENLFLMGNVYHTEALATQARDKQILLVELQDFADRENEGHVDDKGWFFIDYYNSKFDCRSNASTVSLVRFFDKNDVHAAIDHFGDRLNLLK